MKKIVLAFLNSNIDAVKIFKPRWLLILSFMVWVGLASGGLYFYKGSSVVFTVFSVVFLYLIADGIMRLPSLGYFFLSLFLFLGFWLKLVIHLIVGYSFLEPTGYFRGSADAWDHVLIVSTVGALGVIIAKLMYPKYQFRDAWVSEKIFYLSPSWYPRLRIWLWSFLIVLSIGLPVLNLTLEIFQVGLIPTKPLPWPLNTVIAWTMAFCLPASLATLVYWDHAIRARWALGFFAMSTEGILSAASVLSRATYLFHTFPYLLVLNFKRFRADRVSIATKIGIFICWVGIFLASLSSVTFLRYSDSSPIDGSRDKYLTNSEDPPVYLGKIGTGITRLLVDRWIGVEGVMAVTAYPERGFGLLGAALTERISPGVIDLYTQRITKYAATDAELKRYRYASIPGGPAFFYYSGSLLMVLIGMGLLTRLLLESERLVHFISRNPYMCGFWSMGVAQIVASFGIGLWQSAIYYAFCFLVMSIIGLIQHLSPKIYLEVD